MIKVNTLKFTKDNRCASCVHCMYDGDPINFNDAEDYPCSLQYDYRAKDANPYCENVRKHLCHGERFVNNEPINDLFPNLPINVIAVKPEPPKPTFNHFRAAGIVFGLGILIAFVRVVVLGY